MDVHCSTCREPWDTWHLFEDAIHETDLTEEECKHWIEGPEDKRLSEFYREALKRAGWEFGESILAIRHCPCCPENAERDPDGEAMRDMIVELFGDDIDAIALTLNDFDL